MKIPRVDFVPVHVKHSSERTFFSHARKNKNESYQQNGIPMAFKILNNFLVIQNQGALKIPNVLMLHHHKFHPLIKMAVFFSLRMSESRNSPIHTDFVNYTDT